MPFPINCSCPVFTLTNTIRFLRRPTVQSRRRVSGSISGEQSDRRNVFLLRGPCPFSLCISSTLLRNHSSVYHPPTLLCPSTTGLAYNHRMEHEWFKYLFPAESVLFVVAIHVHKLITSIILLLAHRNVFRMLHHMRLISSFSFEFCTTVSTVQPHLADMEEFQ